MNHTCETCKNMCDWHPDRAFGGPPNPSAVYWVYNGGNSWFTSRYFMFNYFSPTRFESVRLLYKYI